MPPSLTKNDIISNIYYDLTDGYGSIKNTLEQAQKVDKTITYDEVSKWMKQQPNKQRKAYKGSNSYTAPFARYEYQIDIMDMVDLQETEDTPRYGLVCIDIFSKLGDVVPMKNKDSITVYNALLNFFQKMGYPINVYSDDDGAFKSKVKEFFEGEAINHITTLTHANVAERFIRTLKNGIHDRVRFTKAPWHEMLEYVIRKYNNTVHSSTNHKPIDAHKDKYAGDVAANLSIKSINKRKYKNINIGDEVNFFTKGKGNYTSRKETTSRWSTSTYKVLKIEKDITLDSYYILEGLNRRYRRHEILLVN